MRNKYLYITAFISGFVLMGFEVFGTRVLAPYFGSGMHVWGALISVVLGGLSIGYAVGGNQADKSEPEKKLFIVLTSAGILLILFHPASVFVCKWVDSFQMGRKFSTLLCAVSLFLIPALFLGMVSPLLVKLKIKSLDAVGQGAGMIYSVATVGSIAGTLITAYALIGTLSSSSAISLFGGILIANAMIVKLFLKRSETKKKRQIS